MKDDIISGMMGETDKKPDIVVVALAAIGLMAVVELAGACVTKASAKWTEYKANKEKKENK